MAAQVRGSAGTATVTVRATDGIDELDFAARGLPHARLYRVRRAPRRTSSPLTAITAAADGTSTKRSHSPTFSVSTHRCTSRRGAAAAATNAELCTLTGP